MTPERLQELSDGTGAPMSDEERQEAETMFRRALHNIRHRFRLMHDVMDLHELDGYFDVIDNIPKDDDTKAGRWMTSEELDRQCGL